MGGFGFQPPEISKENAIKDRINETEKHPELSGFRESFKDKVKDAAIIVGGVVVLVAIMVGIVYLRYHH